MRRVGAKWSCLILKNLKESDKNRWRGNDVDYPS